MHPVLEIIQSQIRNKGFPVKRIASILAWLAVFIAPCAALPADRLLGVHSARVMSHSMPWIAAEAELFRKYDIEFPLVYIGFIAASDGGDARWQRRAAHGWRWESCVPTFRETRSLSVSAAKKIF
jgi:hypothetical protein